MHGIGGYSPGPCADASLRTAAALNGSTNDDDALANDEASLESSDAEKFIRLMPGIAGARGGAARLPKA